MFTFVRKLIEWVQTASSAALIKLFYQPPSNWDELSPEDGAVVWQGLTALLAYHGFVHHKSAEYQALPPPPPISPQNPFRPSPNEDFVHRIPNGRPVPKTFWVPRGTHIIGADGLGREVNIKAIRSDSREMQVLRHLSSPQLAASDLNHTLPVLSTIVLRDWTIIVQPYWGILWHRPPRDICVRRLQVARQLLEGLSFMHSHRVSHSDIHGSNLLVSHEDGRFRDPSYQTDVDVRVAFIDFESSFLFPEDAGAHIINATDMETAPPARIRAPEQDSDSWDAFPADVYNLGRCFRVWLLNKDLEAMPRFIELIDAMTKQEPSDRLSSREALCLMEKLLAELDECDHDDTQLKDVMKKDL